MLIQFLGIVVLGLAAGWLINYLGDVLPYKRRLTKPFCTCCGQELGWKDYILLHNCPACQKSNRLRKEIVLGLSIAVAIGLWLTPTSRIGFWPGVLLLVYFGVVALIDLEHRLILHPVSIAGAVIGLAVGVWWHGVVTTILGGIAGFGIMLALYYLGELFAKGLARLRGQQIDEVALGFGDVNLSGVLGLVLGWPGIAAGLILAILLGGVVSILFLAGQLLWRRYQAFTAIPYAPFLILGTVVLIYMPALP